VGGTRPDEHIRGRRPTVPKTRTEPVTATVVVIRIALRMVSLHRMVNAAVVRTRSLRGFAVGVATVSALVGVPGFWRRRDAVHSEGYVVARASGKHDWRRGRARAL